MQHCLLRFGGHLHKLASFYLEQILEMIDSARFEGGAKFNGQWDASNKPQAACRIGQLCIEYALNTKDR